MRTKKRQIGAESARPAKRGLPVGGPIEDDLTVQLEELDNAQAHLGVERVQREAWLLEHPTVVERLADLRSDPSFFRTRVATRSG